ncbi:MAG TPA: glycosyltransferase family 39 protein [Pyrinomonadaceae bacterium]|nr:glycosyltransferase family 39 protein [Pyrinomonadaceae bacterium]
MLENSDTSLPAYSQGADLRLDLRVLVALILLVLIGLAFRVNQLGAIGFAEDEVNKVDAVRAYERGDITANAEHPMLMKVLMFASVKVARALKGQGGYSDEVVFRLPNAIVGALTVIPLFLLTTAFFDRWTGLLAAAFWSVGVNAITLNRVGKEDTLLVFFMLFACYFYLRAKQTDSRETKMRGRHYLWSGVSFGLMMASKYFPHYLGLNSLYHHYARVRKRLPGEPSGKTSLIFYIAMAVAFLVANPAVLLPEVWEYLRAYMGEKLLVHSGYLLGDQLYQNRMSASPFWGMPIYFYLLFMAIKIPLLVLSAFVGGLVISIKRWRHPGHAFVLFMLFFWIVPYSLAGAKWLRYTLSLMPFVYMCAAIGLFQFIRLVSVRLPAAPVRAPVVSVVLLLFMVWPGVSAYRAAPHYGLYTNAVATNHRGYFFPHDEFYDDGLREAIKFVCDQAPRGAVISHETPAVTRYYLEKFGRTDLNSKPLSAPDFDVKTISGPAYVIIQRGRTYFENREKMQFVRANFRLIHEQKVSGITAAEVFTNQIQ